jgi:hypothetical protein
VGEKVFSECRRPEKIAQFDGKSEQQGIGAHADSKENADDGRRLRGCPQLCGSRRAKVGDSDQSHFDFPPTEEYDERADEINAFSILSGSCRMERNDA